MSDLYADHTPETPAEEGDPRIKRANAEAARYRVERNAARSEAQALRAQLDTLQTQMQHAEQDIQAERLAQLRLRIGMEAGLPLGLVERLQGEDEAALHADAAQLSQLIQISALPEEKRPAAIAGKSGKYVPSEGALRILDRIKGVEVNLFDPNFQRAHGGGTIVLSDKE